MSPDTRDDSKEDSGSDLTPSSEGEVTATADGAARDEISMPVEDTSADDETVEIDGQATAAADDKSDGASDEAAMNLDDDDDMAGAVDAASGVDDEDKTAIVPPPAAAVEPGEAPVLDAEGKPVEFSWFVLRVQSGREDTCANALRKKVVLAKVEHLIKEIAVPKRKMTEIKEGKRRVRAEKLFPGYILIHMCLHDDLWYLIRDTSGIGDFVGSHQMPTAMPAAEVKKIMEMMEEKEDEAPEVKIDLSKNDMVKIKEGPFENFDGVVEEVHPTKGTVRVMVTIFGRATPVDLEYWQVEKL